MITQSIRNIRRMELGEITHNKDTGEASRELYLETTDGQISILLVAPLFKAESLKVIDYELKKIMS